jgi:hypothetical protein
LLEPERLATMQADYKTYVLKMGVLDVPPGYGVQRQVLTNALMKQLGFYWWILVIAALVFGGAVFLLARLMFRLRRRN